MTASPFARTRQCVAEQRQARAAPKTDVDILVRPCPASQPHVFVVPVRYALAEHALQHRACPLDEPLESRPMALRRLRGGFLYLWQQQGPLKRFAVANNGLLLEQPLNAPAEPPSDGSLTGLALDKQEDAWLCFTEHPLVAVQCQRLADRNVREQHMRYLDLRRVANTLEAPHCPPVDHAEKLIAELDSGAYTRSLAVGYQRNGEAQRQEANRLLQQVVKNPSDDNVDAYTDAKLRYVEGKQASEQLPHIDAQTPPPGAWSAQPWDARATKAWLEAVQAQAAALYPVFACLNDELGLLRDINHEQEYVQAQHEQWQQDHAIRLQVGGFVRSLVEESASELAGMITYRYREQNLQLTTAQGETLLKAHHELEGLFREESAINQERGRKYSHKEADAELNRVWLKKDQCLRPVREFITPELHNEIEAMVREYRAEKVDNLNKWNGHEVEDYIDLPAMNTWLDETAPKHFEQVKAQQERLLKDRRRLLHEHHRATWFIDHEDLPTRRWLDNMAMACLSAQCLAQAGAEQYAEYLHSDDPGILRQLVYAWNPSLEASLVSTSRAGELATALALENRQQAAAALHKVLAPISSAVLTDIGLMAGPEESTFSLLLKRLGSAILLLGKDSPDSLPPAWSNLLVMARLSSDSAIRWVSEGGQRTLAFVGGTGQALSEWTRRTAQAIGLGKVEAIRNASIIQNSGGVLPLAVMILNLASAQRYLSQLQAVPRPDQQRMYDTASSVLYAGAALTAVMDNQLRKGLKVDVLGRAQLHASVVTLLGGLIGLLSAAAAANEFASLNMQLEASRWSTDPWLKFRRGVVGGLLVTYTAQALAGAFYTSQVIAGALSTTAALAGYALWMGPLSILIAVLGVLYFITWLFQQTPLQNFLDNCCWSKSRSLQKLAITHEHQRAELETLFKILYTPRISFTSKNHRVSSQNTYSGISFVSIIESLTIDLPSANPETTHLELAIIGYSIDEEALQGQISGTLTRTTQPPRKWTDLTRDWLSKSTCSWIPTEEGQGLRITGPLPGSRALSRPTKVNVRICYKNPTTSLLGEKYFVGGEPGMTFSLSYVNGVLTLREEDSDILENTQNLLLADGSGPSHYLTPGVKR